VLIGYARVSTADQDPALQITALRASGARRIVQECRSGVAERPELEKLLSRLKANDVWMAYKVDRLARSLADLLRVIATVSAAGATFKSRTEPIETTTPAGRMMVQLLGAFAEFEREVIRERCTAGRQEARERGVRFGRPYALSEAQVEKAQLMQKEGRSIASIARTYGVHPDTLGRALGKRRSLRA